MASGAEYSTVETERRDHQRRSVPVLAVELGGRVYCTANWSMGGLLLENYDGPLTAGSLVTVAGIGDSAASVDPVNVRARVIRSDCHSGFLALTILGMDTAAYDLFKRRIAGRNDTLRAS